MDAERIEIVEMTPGESAWHKWAMSTDVDTRGECTCGHEGLSLDWHSFDCRAADNLLRRKTLELFGRVAELEGERPSDLSRGALITDRDEIAALLEQHPDAECWKLTHVGRPCGPGCLMYRPPL